MGTSSPFLLLLSLVMICFALGTASFYDDFVIVWGSNKARILNNGDLITLSLDKNSGSGFESKREYLFGKINVQLKLVPGNSAGTVTSYYFASKGSSWDEIDFEFLGNLSGEPYTVHTNIITQGKGDREQQFHLWFDPTLDFHNYSILWNPLTVVFFIDGTPIRQFKNMNSKGIPFPRNQAMKMHFSLWNADDWATRGGLIKTDWTQAPFTASFRNFNARACVWSAGASSCSVSSPSSRPTRHKWLTKRLHITSLQRLKWVQNNYMIYDYCTDTKRFPQGPPLECATN
ncbi:xyloglucan endotransglucosylase/hydrolase protein 22 [Manihot esculenta]|uniref:Xyloglucan endotransglucosylase/hydrolase n=1 Tax=Manihot esculenta TaxID=3983 RepID=A0A2C9W5L1_MANES|nr:xyloglucan endotransglucosylase/hydrolase protein 22 [Manihot esculenta]OAY54499.1 hypothetical protein MANES_03G079700v8 [Manihot esculenta]